MEPQPQGTPPQPGRQQGIRQLTVPPLAKRGASARQPVPPAPGATPSTVQPPGPGRPPEGAAGQPAAFAPTAFGRASADPDPARRSRQQPPARSTPDRPTGPWPPTEPARHQLPEPATPGSPPESAPRHGAGGHDHRPDTVGSVVGKAGPAIPPPFLNVATRPATAASKPATLSKLSRPSTAASAKIADGAAEATPAAAGSAPALGGFVSANTVEENLLEAAQQRRTDRFLSTLLLAKVLVVGWNDNDVPDPQRWTLEEIAGAQHLVAYTSSERMTDRLGADAVGGWARFTTLISAWPGDHLPFAVNPDTPVGATLPGNEVMALAAWAAKMGLTEDLEPEAEPAAESAADPTEEPTDVDEPLVMQKSIAPTQVPLYLDRGYDRVSGFVHRANEVDHLCTPEQIYRTLGLGYSGSPFRPDAAEVYLLRWRAYRGDLYRIPYGGQTDAAMRAMEGWVVERTPFRGNGFAPCDTGDVISEFKVDSVRLPHGAQLWKLDREGNERLIALHDADGPRWRRVGA
ncbi:MAG: hypothetical protein HKP61_19290 [Dactylosporangium sp.]|nr:hypothetical protein [Dactylosporangium sp.]